MQHQGRPEGTPGGEPRPLFGGTATGGHTTGGSSGMGTMSAQDERLWSILSHVSMIVAPIGALIIWLVFKDQSSRVRFHALQSLWYQLAWMVIFIAYWTLTTIISIVTFGIAGIVLIPLGFLLILVPLAHAGYAAYRVSQGEDYRYPFVADRIGGGSGRVA